MNIQHESENYRFTAGIDGSDELVLLTYQRISSTAVNFNYSYVPAAFRGKGMAKQLVDHGFQWAKDQNLNIQASCSYVAKFL